MLTKGKRLGKGAFSTVYEDSANPGKVWIFTTDKAKAALADGIVSSNMLPEMKLSDFEPVNDDRQVYHAQKFAKVRAPKQELSKKGYRQYTLLRKAAENIEYSYNHHDSYFNVYKSFESIPDKTLREEMLSILDAYRNYGSDVMFEISPRNIAVGKNKSLVLLDCFYFRNDLKR